MIYNQPCLCKEASKKKKKKNQKKGVQKTFRLVNTRILRKNGTLGDGMEALCLFPYTLPHAFLPPDSS